MSSPLSILTCTVRGCGPVQPGLAIIRVFTGMLSRDVEVRPAADRTEDEGPSVSSPKVILIIIQHGRNVEEIS